MYLALSHPKKSPPGWTPTSFTNINKSTTYYLARLDPRYSPTTHYRELGPSGVSAAVGAFGFIASQYFLAKFLLVFMLCSLIVGITVYMLWF